VVKLRHGSLFSGIGGIELGFEWAGIETVWQVEINPFSNRVLEARWPGVHRELDVRTAGKHNLEPVDIISGGFPCQDISIGGRKAGLGTADAPTERSGLWFQYHRVVEELRPRWVLIENVSRLRDHGADQVIDDMEGIGYACWPQVVDAESLGAPHGRDRTFIFCCDNAYRDGYLGEIMAGARPVESAASLPPDFQGPLAQAGEKWDYWKHELGSGNDGQDGGAAEPESDAYARGVRAAHGIPDWSHRLKACGNAVVPEIPALFGLFIQQCESRLAEEAQAPVL
jgi:DNA (cytosine-5)-methyltransferase 1